MSTRKRNTLDLGLPVLAVLATYVGIGDLPKAIRETLMKLKDKAQEPVKAVLKILAKPIKAAFDALLKRLGLGDREPVVDPLDFGKDKKKRLYVTGDGKVWMRASPDTEVIPWLEMKAKGTGTDSAKAKDALVVARKLGEDGKKVKAESSKTQRAGTVKGVGIAVQTALANEKKLAALLDMLGYDDCGCDGTVDTETDSSKLSDNLVNGKCGPPDSKSISDKSQAHHIIPGGSSRDGIVRARIKLTSSPVCIGVNDAINGVFLPQTSKTSSNPKMRTFHNCTFRNDYYAWIADEFASVKADRTAMWAKLLELRAKLESGAKWPRLNLDPTMKMDSCADS